MNPDMGGEVNDASWPVGRSERTGYPEKSPVEVHARSIAEKTDKTGAEKPRRCNWSSINGQALRVFAENDQHPLLDTDDAGNLT